MVADGHIPEGELCRSRTDADIGETLAGVLDRELTGYVVFEPQGSILFGNDERAVLTFEAGVPVLAYHSASDAGGRAALDALTGDLFHAEVYELAADALAAAHRVEELRVAPSAPADVLADDETLVDRTRDAAPEDRLADAAGASAVEAFLADADRIDAIRDEARAEAQARAAEWGLAEQLDGEEPPDSSG
ncbi:MULTISPECIES: hypothetical protein [Halobellus]|uniref:hypothetical protein n=1 Tax=Halobellus TaxID=1073986 RepID=UPI002114C09C|nr:MULTISPECIES: hypothetical protein [Halobellus]MDQ2053095.1 hypothetical protein [Halobellus sp. H-GB7]